MATLALFLLIHLLIEVTYQHSSSIAAGLQR